VKGLTEEVQRLERLKAGALAKAKQQVKKLQAEGKGKDDIQADVDYKKCLSAYNDFSSTLSEKQDRIGELETDIADYGRRIDEHKIQLQELARGIEKIRTEKSDAVADFITAKEEKDLADAFSGIAEDGSAKELQRLRQLRQEVKAEARVSKELAGTDTKVQEAEFLEYARTSTSNTEFDALIGLADSPTVDAEPAEKKRSGTKEPSSLPE
jgi:phage shock protein A